MKDTVKTFPDTFDKIIEDTKMIGFDQLSEPLLGSFLSTMSASKQNGNFLEFGTGSGLSTAWILHGMDPSSSLVTIDNDEKRVSIAKKHLGKDDRVKFIIGEGEALISNTAPCSIDFIFADAWAGKYLDIEATLLLLKPGGIYIIDDMSPRESWPVGHAEKADHLIQYLENRVDFAMTKMSWSSGIVICTKRV